MFTTKYWKNAPKPKRRVRKYEDGGPVDPEANADIETAAEPKDDKSIDKSSKDNPFSSKKWSAVSKAMAGSKGEADTRRRRLSDPEFEAKPFRTDY